MRFAINNKSARRIALAVGLAAVSILECNCLFASEKGLKTTDAKYGGDGMAVASGLVQKSKQSIEPLDANILKKLDSGEILSAEVSFSLKFGKFTKIDESQAADMISSFLEKEVGIKDPSKLKLDPSKLKFTKAKAGFGESRYEAVVTIERKEKKEIDSIDVTLSNIEKKTGDSLADMNEIDIDKLNDRLKEFGSIKDSDDVTNLLTRISELKKNRGEAIVKKEERLKAEEAKKTAEKEAIEKQKELERIAKETEMKKKEEAKAFETGKKRYQELTEKSEKAKAKEAERLKKEAEKKQMIADFEVAQKEADRAELEAKAKITEEEAEKERKFKIDDAQRDKEFKETVQKEKEAKAKKLEEKAAAAAEKNKLKEMISKVEPIEAPKPEMQAAALKARVKTVDEAVKTLQSANLDYVASMINDAISTKETSLSEPGSKSEVSKTFESIKKAFGTEGNVIESDRVRILLEKWDDEGKQYAIKFVPKVTMK